MANILVVDDEEFILDIIKEIVEDEMGHTVKITLNGELGLEMANKEKFDLIMTDFHMPVMTGADFIRSARSSEDNVNYQTPVMFISAFSDPVKDQMKDHENVSFLEKPIIIPKLIEAVTKVLNP